MGQNYPNVATNAGSETKNVENLKTRVDSVRSCFSGTAPPTGNIVDGQFYYDTANKKLYELHGTEWLPITAILKNKLFYKNLVITNDDTTPTTKLDITADFISCVGYSTSSLSKTLDTAGTGVNGLDTGSLASNTWYYIYLIIDLGSSAIGTSPTFNTLLSLNSTSPTLPSGYDYSVRIGAIRTKSTVEEFRQFYQSDNSVYYTNTSIVDTPSDADCNVLLAGTVTTFTNVANLGKSVPYTGTAYLSRNVRMLSNLGAGSSMFVRPASVNTAIGGVKLHATTGWIQSEVPCSSTGLEYKVGGTTPSGTLYVIGYNDIIG